MKMYKKLIYLMMFLVLISSVYADYTKNIVAVYNMTTTLNMSDASGNKNWGAKTGTITTNGVNKIGLAYNFTGAGNYMSVATLTYADFLSQKITACWHQYLTTADLGASTYYVWGSTASNIDVWTGIANKRVQWYVSGGNFDDNNLISPSDLTSGWKFFCVQWQQSPNEIAIWVNGVRVKNATAKNYNMENAPAFSVGTMSTAASGIDGKLDEFTFWNSTLTQADILFLNSTTLNYPWSTPTPVISAIKIINISTTTENITWTTDISSNTSVNYGLTKALGTYSSTNDAVTTHTRTLSSLTPATFYYFNVTSCLNNKCAKYGVLNFTTKTQIKNLTITATSPANNTQFGSNPIIFIANITSNNTQINCSLSINLVKQTPSKIIIPAYGKLKVNFSKTFSGSQPINFTINCFINASIYTANSTMKTIFFDQTPPTIATTYLNKSIYDGVSLTTITKQWNFTDEFKLYSWNISIDNKELASKTNINTKFYQYNSSKSITTYTQGRHNLTSRVCDGHTANILKDSYDFSTALNTDTLNQDIFTDLMQKVQKRLKDVVGINPEQGNELVIDAKQHITITAEDSSYNDAWTTDQGRDRFTFTYTPETPKEVYVFDVSSDIPMVLRTDEDTEYKQWLIIGNEKWLDFLLANEPNEEISIEMLDDYNAKVTISNIQNEVLQFKSIGELNCVTLQQYFYKTTPAKIKQQSGFVLETQLAVYNLSINKSGFTTAATLTINGTNYIPTKSAETNRDNYSVSVYVPLLPTAKNTTRSGRWNITLTGAVNTINTNYSFNQTIYQIEISNCSTYPTNHSILNYLIQDEDTGFVISANVSALFHIYASNPAMNKSYDLKWNVPSSGAFSMCMYPNATVHTYYNLYDVRAYGFGVRTSNIITLTLQWHPVVQQIFTLVHSPVYQVLTILDELSQAYVGYNINLYRLNALNSSLIFSQTDISDFNGNVLFSINPTVKYRVLIYNPSGTLVKNSGNFYFVSNPYVLRFQKNTTNTFIPILNDNLALFFNYSNQQSTLTFSITNVTP